MSALSSLLLPAAALAREAGPWKVADSGLAARPLTMMAVLAALSLVPFAVMMLTSFSKITVVLSLARSAMGTQQAPPTMILTGLAAILTAHIMAPVAERMYRAGETASARVESGADLVAAAKATAEPLREFLLKHAGADERARFADLARELRPPSEAELVADTDLSVVVPAFAITELEEAFHIGFLVFLPFLVLDMLVANVLLALGMQSLSPTQVSLPFKILLFVAVDGWALLARGLILGYR
ncbi:MAG TPA: type III secretion system export apparatus subunit SctR [Myxococcales bacterium]|jgi:type III secretion protein R|nr:type III secretion system export apparatus subunit SctR [Myxococcales bacterium]